MLMLVYLYRSLVGREDIRLQHAFIQAIPHTDVQLFVPSDLAFRCDEQGLRISVNKEKDDVERAAREAGVATCVILPGVFAESGLNTGYVSCFQIIIIIVVVVLEHRLRWKLEAGRRS